MDRLRSFSVSRRHAAICAALVMAMAPRLAAASTLAIPAPLGSASFGWQVKTLPNGNIVVGDPQGGPNQSGAVYLYAPDGTQISALTGSTAKDDVGEFPIVVLPNGNFLVTSLFWSNGNAFAAGAVTWVNGTTGLNGVISAENSLVGSSTYDEVGQYIFVLANGNYVVDTPNWSNGSVGFAGAVTFERGGGPTQGAVSATNSLVGASIRDYVGEGIVPLANGNYLVASPHWSNDGIASVGAVTWASGETGITGLILATNSLVGAQANDAIGGGGEFPSVWALSNGNAVVLSPDWDNGAIVDAGAATWINGASGLAGHVSAANSLVGTSPGDMIGSIGPPTSVLELPGNRFAVFSPQWSSAAASHVGAITWADGANGSFGAVSASNSLVGTSTDDFDRALITVLANQNWVVGNAFWSDGAAARVGASTWIDGHAPRVGPVSAQNSLIGSTPKDDVGTAVYALTNGNYVVASPDWQNQNAAEAGAATWADGSTQLTGVVSIENSLVGTHPNDLVGDYNYFNGNGVVALTNGNYIVLSPNWNGDAGQQIGAATWCNGTTGSTGAVSADNSLVGDTTLAGVAAYAVALGNGNAVIGSPYWHDVGAATWINGATGLVGTVSAANSLLGTSPGVVGNLVVDGSDYFDADPKWGSGDIGEAGAVTWGDGNAGVTGFETADNSLIGDAYLDEIGGTVTIVGNGNVVITGENSMTLARSSSPIVGTPDAGNSVLLSHGPAAAFDYDVIHDRLVVGAPRDHAVYVFQAELLFQSGFD